MSVPLVRDDSPVSPKTVSPRGVHEDTCWAIWPDADGQRVFALKAINAEGECIAYALVRTRQQYEQESARLWAALDAHETAKRASVPSVLAFARDAAPAR